MKVLPLLKYDFKNTGIGVRNAQYAITFSTFELICFGFDCCSDHWGVKLGGGGGVKTSQEALSQRYQHLQKGIPLLWHTCRAFLLLILVKIFRWSTWFFKIFRNRLNSQSLNWFFKILRHFLKNNHKSHDPVVF